MLDVLCIGHASYDLIFSVAHHPQADEKMFAEHLLGCGGGPAANAAVQVARLGYKAGFCGYLGNDTFGKAHLLELQQQGIDTQLVETGSSPTPLSTILVKPDGKRALVNYKGQTQALSADRIDFRHCHPSVLLMDGHEPHLSEAAMAHFRTQNVATVLDAGSMHEGTLRLLNQVDYLVASEKFACQYAGPPEQALSQLASIAPVVIITLGERGIIWQHAAQTGHLAAPPADVVDTTGAGDAFHGAFAAGLAGNLQWPNLLRYASMAGALCCERMGARPGLANLENLQLKLSDWQQFTN